MCGRFTQIDPDSLVSEFSELRLPPGLELQPRYNIAPTQRALVIRAVDPQQGPRADLLRWGLIPSWAKDPALGSRMINARVETAAVKPAFRSALKRRRCIVPATGFYEWLREGRTRQPIYLSPIDGQPLALAGLWETWGLDRGEPLETFTILTTDALPPVTEVHDRMPVFVSRPQRKAWLGPSTETGTLLESLLSTAPPALQLTRVSQRVNSPRNDDPGCIAP